MWFFKLPLAFQWYFLLKILYIYHNHINLLRGKKTISSWILSKVKAEVTYINFKKKYLLIQSEIALNWNFYTLALILS